MLLHVYFRIAQQTRHNRTSELHMQPIPHLIKNSVFTIKRPSALYAFVGTNNKYSGV